MKRFFSALVLGGVCTLTACSGSKSVEPVRVFPNAPEPTPFTRAYSMTEAPDGIRFYVQEDGDSTQLKFIRPDGSGWGAPELVDLPNRGSLTGPHFSRFDSMFYFSSDAVFPEREGSKDLNIWRAEYLGDGQFGEAEPLPMPQVNTGANETETATTRDGAVFFVSNHSRGGTGGYDIMQARESADGDWMVETMPEGINHRLTEGHLTVDPDGHWMIFYSHRDPKVGMTDLWLSERAENGPWQVPENLGPFINTTQIEYGAGLSWDTETFFFSRDGMLMEVPLSAVLEADRTF